MKIIGFSAKKQGGKTTAANSLQQQYKGYSERICFADYLKQIVTWCFCNKISTLEDEADKQAALPCGKTAREVLQIVGTDWFRGLDDNCWVRAYQREVHKSTCGESDSDKEYLILTPDVRFPNEVKCIQEMGGHVIRLLRAPFSEDKHESETALDRMEAMSIPRLCKMFRENLGDTVFDAIVDNRKMTIPEQNEAVWKLVTERNWI